MNDILKINGSNYNRTETSVVIDGVGFDELDLSNPTEPTGYFVSLEYSDSQGKAFGYTADSLNPTRVDIQNVEASGTLVLTDAGIDALTKWANDAGYTKYMFAGMLSKVNITVTYTLMNGSIKTDTLDNVLFNSYNKGINNSDGLYDRDIELMIGRISHGDVTT